MTAATSALHHPGGTGWQSFNLVLTESYHEARRSLMVVRTNYGPLVLFSTYILSVNMGTRCMYLISFTPLQILNSVGFSLISATKEIQEYMKNILTG